MIKQKQLYSLVHRRSDSDLRSLHTMFTSLSSHNCIVLKDLWTYFIEGNRNIYVVGLQACKQQKYLKNPLFCYWSKGVLETLLWQQFLPSGRSMPLSVHGNKTGGGVFQNCCPPPLDHYRCADLLARAPAAGAFNKIWLKELFIGPCTENKEILLTNRVLSQKTALHGTPVFQERQTSSLPC